ncbi:MAG: NAD(P)/FAD-dependent oxidoreductase [Candidatus Methanomethylophilaceae archaeon]|jgi:digeranylgeranylglycerophospholipid reductase|nr:NAD(P)/FAD-dependent oxidoreductase [Candidatus Methanomethylophilaceae archaeon]NLF33516.1 NAD(P)/FAD-dependent oxidoreductase [Thermoplasmatales archaeon]
MVFHKTDVLIVGSGPAGSTTARFAAAKGLSVTMIERRPEVGVPVRCGEFLPSSEEIGDMFPKAADLESLFEVPGDLRLRELEGIRLVDPKMRSTLLDFSGYTTDRDRFDKHLVSLAEKEGAELITDCLFKRIEDGRAVTALGDIQYKVVVGADGPGSRVARSLGLPANRMPYPAVTAQAKGDFDPCIVMFFGGVAPGAYGWIIPKKGQANVGVGFSPRFASGSLSGYFDSFAGRHGLETMGRTEGKFVPSEGPISETVSGNGMVVGDAAGHVISVNGGGIPTAMIAGRICGSVAGDHILNGRPLNDYQREWRDIMLKPLKKAVFNKKLADTFAFGSDARTAICMRMLGGRRMGKLIRCRSIFP